MKKLLSVILTVVLVLSSFSVVAFAASPSADVYVSISASKGKLNMAYVCVKVTDIDSDGVLTINDALYCAHEKEYKGGAKEGYASYKHPLYSGLSLSKLWGVENAGYGYYVNNNSAFSLLDTVSENDHVYAFVYSDNKDFSDEYAFFTQNSASAKAGEEVTLELKSLSYNAFWQLEENPVSGAVITVNGKKTKVVTDENGCAKVTLTKKGNNIISAESPEGAVITPPVCSVNVSGSVLSLIVYYIKLIISSILGLIGK